MNTCRTCRHWNRGFLHPIGEWVPSGPLGDCRRIPIGDNDDPEINAAAVVTLDAATLVTGEEFGCRLWEAT